MSTYSFGAADAFDAFVYGAPHPNTISSIQGQLTQMSQNVVGAGLAFMQKAQDAFNYFNSSAAFQFVRSVLQSATETGVVETTRVMPLLNLLDLQGASLTMQRWIMANPTVRALYYQQRCDGYADTYVDAHPGDIGKLHHDYRRVMDGMLEFDDKGEWVITHYLDVLGEDEAPLPFLSKVDILRTWQASDLLLAISKDDLTSKEGGTL